MQDLGDKLFRFRLNKDLKYIVWDTETESLNLGYSRPWEMAWAVVENGQIKEEFDLFPFIHDLNVGEGAAAVTRFNYDEYKAKSSPAIDCYNSFAKYLYNPDYLIVGQNLLNFDVYMLTNLQKYLGIKPDFSYIDRIYDTKSINFAWQTGSPFPKVKSEITPWMFKNSSTYKKGIKTSNAAAAKMLEIQYNVNLAHGALFDSKLSNEIFKQLIWKLEVW